MSTEATPRRRPSRRGEGINLRAEIVDAASELLADANDVAAVSLRAVARRVGIATTSIYLHFADLGELLEAVSIARFNELYEALTRALEDAGTDPATRIQESLKAYVQFGLEHPAAYWVMFTAKRGTEHPQGAVGLYVFELLLNNTAAALHLASGSKEAHCVATSLWTLCDGLVHLRASRPDFPWPELSGQIDDTVNRLFGVVPENSG
jgi:AcrR family transcriptional regulator